MSRREVCLNILYAYRYGIVGGVSTQLMLRKQALEQAGQRCQLFFSQDNGLRGVLPTENSRVHFGSVEVFRRLLRQRFDAIVVIDTPELLGPAIGPLWRRNRVFLDIHTTTQTGLGYLDGLSLQKIAGVMVPSSYSRNLVARKRPDWTAQLHIIPNLLNSSVFRPSEQEGAESGVRHFVWVGKLDRHKNWRLALIYAAMLRKMLGDIHLHMVGGYTAPPATAEAFFELAYRLGVSEVVTWLDRVENVQLANLYHRCARSGGAMLVTSRDESFGMAAAEALLCGCPLVTNDLPVFREVLPESPMLQRVDIWQPEAVAEAVRSLIEFPPSAADRQVMYDTLSARYGAPAFIAALQEAMGDGT